MPEKIGEFYYTITADNKIALTAIAETEKGFDGLGRKTGMLSQTIGGIKAGWLAMAGAVAVGLKFVTSAVNEAIDKARSNVVFENALKKVGQSIKDVQGDLESLSKINAFDDDAIKQIYSYGIAMGIPAEKLKQFAQTSIDFSAQSGKGLEMSMRTVAATAKDSAEKFDALSQSVAGAGKAYANADGGIKRLQISYNELLASIGNQILLELTPVIKELTKAFDGLKAIMDKTFGGTIEEKIDKQKEKIKQLQEKVTARINLEKNGIGGLFGKTEAQAIKAIEKTPDYVNLNREKEKLAILEAQAEAIKKQKPTQSELLELETAREDKAKKLLEATNNYNSALQSATDVLSGILPVTSEAAKSFKSMFDNLTKIASKANELIEASKSSAAGFSTANLSLESQLSIASLIVTAFLSIGDAIQGAMDKLSGFQEGIDAINKVISDYKAVLEDLNRASGKANANDQINKINAKETQKSYQDQINSKQDIININKKAIAQDKEIIKAAGDRSQATRQGLKQQYDDAINFYNENKDNFFSGGAARQSKKIADLIKTRLDLIEAADAAEADINTKIVQNAQLEKDISNLKIARNTVDQTNALKNAEMNRQLLESQKKNGADNTEINSQISEIIKAEMETYQKLIEKTEDRTKQLEYQIEISKLQNNLDEINGEINEKTMKILQEQTAEMERQKNLVNQTIADQFKYGLLDIQNIADIQAAANQLSMAGYTGTEALSSLASYGIGNADIGAAGVVINGGINITQNEASLDSTMSRSIDIINRKIGGL